MTRAARILTGIAVAGVIVSLIGAVVAWQLVGQLSRTTDRSLVLAGEALVTLEATLDLTEDVIASLDDTLEGVADTIALTANGVGDASAVAVATGEVLAVVGPRLEGIEGAIGSIAEIAGTADNVLRQLSRLPLAPSYDPDREIGDELRGLGTDLGSVGRSLQTASSELLELGGSTDELVAELRSIGTDVTRLRTSLDGTGTLLDAYRFTVQGSAALAQEAQDDLDRDLRMTRLLIVLLAVTFAIGQATPALVVARQHI